ncbi:MAG TPA: endonuclease/exonuclease/phosphatase family protein [Methylomirabilota bacterium]|nr:endonuclease/exonuclease/phosphatase family protein [Methylomirabilota bacterium]
MTRESLLFRLVLACLAGWLWTLSLTAADSFRIASFNVENYVVTRDTNRPLKSPAARARVQASILAIRPDVLALQEIGGTNALLELQAALRSQGLPLPHWDLVTSYDTNIQVAVLSRFPITARRPHTNDWFLLGGRRFRVSRGFAEVDIRVNDRYAFTLINAHLKSRRPIPEADETEMRQEEARLLRQKINARLRVHPNANLVVLGDLNQTKDAYSTRLIVGSGRNALVDTRPAERNGDNLPPERSGYDPRNIAWTHFYGKEDTYSRVDYILLSPGMAREWIRDETFVLALPNWGLASDHRPIVTTLVAADR